MKHLLSSIQRDFHRANREGVPDVVDTRHDTLHIGRWVAERVEEVLIDDHISENTWETCYQPSRSGAVPKDLFVP
jgi:hypothetical protein